MATGNGTGFKLFGKMITVVFPPRIKEEEKENSVTTQEKKPEKAIPCPRCASMETKFCYYNNYNVNQPRHFCKDCQRYWTAGGSLRNVPVGAGRRKNGQFSHRQVRFPSETATLIVPCDRIAGFWMEGGGGAHSVGGGATVRSFSGEKEISFSHRAFQVKWSQQN